MTPATPAPTAAPFDPHARLDAFLRDAADALRLADSDATLCGRDFHLNIARGCIAGAKDCAAMIAAREAATCETV